MSGCTSAIQVNGYLPVCGKGRHQNVEFESAGGLQNTSEASKLQTDQNLPKSTRKRNKKRPTRNGYMTSHADDLNWAQKNTIEIPEEIYDQPSRSNSDESASFCSKKSSEALVKVSSSSSYAAVVCGRNHANMLEGSGFGLGTDEFAPLLSTSITTVPLLGLHDKMSSTGSALTREVAVQTDVQPCMEDKRKVRTAISRDQSTMTTKKGLCRNKYASANLCCGYDLGTDKLVSCQPPVEFLGEHFTFESTIANTVAQLGIKFADDELPELK